MSDASLIRLEDFISASPQRDSPQSVRPSVCQAKLIQHGILHLSWHQRLFTLHYSAYFWSGGGKKEGSQDISISGGLIPFHLLIRRPACYNAAAANPHLFPRRKESSVATGGPERSCRHQPGLWGEISANEDTRNSIRCIEAADQKTASESRQSSAKVITMRQELKKSSQLLT